MAKLLVMLGSKIDCGVQFLLHPHSVPVVMKSPKPLLASPLNQSEFGSVTTNPPTIVRPAGARQKRAHFCLSGRHLEFLKAVSPVGVSPTSKGKCLPACPLPGWFLQMPTLVAPPVRALCRL